MQKVPKSQVIILVACMTFLSSCYYNKKLVYLQDKEFSEITPTMVEHKKYDYRLQPADIISVQIKSSTETDASYSIFNVASKQFGVYATPGSFFIEGYTIDNTGKITMPILGDVEVKGLSVEEAQRLIQTQANKYLVKSTVIVKLTSFKVTVLGEVKNPGYMYVYNSQVTVFEALGLAGDLTQYGSRKNIKLIRQVPKGSQVILLDLTDSHLLSSDYYYLMPNDVLYVEPLRARSGKTNLEILGVVFAGLTTAVLILSYVNHN